jgi:protein-S-isoprenylcysteine O-methyltransferase Ste14
MPERDPAEARLWIMTLVRLGGIALVLLGMWTAGQSQGAGMPMAAGLVLMGLGAAIALFAPRALARRWKP